MDRRELQQAFDGYVTAVEGVCRTGDWSGFADLFTEDATYCEHVYGDFSGREAIRAWIVKTMTTYPGSEMVAFPPAWSILDPEAARVVCEIRNVMRDPGDGSLHEATNITILTYAGDGLWSREEDVYNPQKFADMMLGWSRAAQANNTLPDEGRALLDALGG